MALIAPFSAPGRFWRGNGWYLLDQMLTEGHRLSAFATDDAHFKTPDHFGGWVHVKAESLDPDALLESLKQGRLRHLILRYGRIIQKRSNISQRTPGLREKRVRERSIRSPSATTLCFESAHRNQANR